MPLSEHVCCVATMFKLTEWVEQKICIKFCTKLEHSSTETTQMIQKTAVMGNCWLAASSRQCACLWITSCAEFFGKTLNHPDDSAPLQPRFGTLQLLCFPQTKITFEREEISDRRWLKKMQRGHWWRLGELYEVPRCLLWKDWGIIVLCTMFLISSSINGSIFHVTCLDTLWTDSIFIFQVHMLKNKELCFSNVALSFLFLVVFDLFPKAKITPNSETIFPRCRPLTHWAHLLRGRYEMLRTLSHLISTEWYEVLK